VPTIY